MSVPTKVIYCDKCDHSIGTTVLHRSYRYVTQESKDIRFYPKIGWCNSCQSLATIEDLAFTLHDFEKLNKLSRELTDDLSKLRGRAFGFLQRKRWKWLIHELENLSESINLLSIKQRRQGAEKCLECGSSDVDVMDTAQPLEPENWPGNYRGSASTGHVHPGCGGTFTVKGSQVRWILRRVEKYFTEDGDFIREEM